MIFTCPRCKTEYDEDKDQLVCPACFKEQLEIEREHDMILAEQERNYWQDTCGSIK